MRAIFTDAQLPGKQLCRESQKSTKEKTFHPLHPLVLDSHACDGTASSWKVCPFPTGTGPETQPHKTPGQTAVSNSVCAHREETGTEWGNLNITVLWLFKSPGNFILFCFWFFLISVNYKTKSHILPKFRDWCDGQIIEFGNKIKYPILLLLFERNEHINAWWLKSLINLIFW